jgi:hypothetical protein
MQINQKNKLHAFAGLIMKIKRVSRLAGDIELTAINGMILANKSGGTSSGFGVVAHEMQALSLLFLHITQELTRLVYQMACLEGKGLNQARRMRILNETALSNERSKRFISHSYENSGKKLSTDAIEIRKSANEVMCLLQRAETQCITGVMLGCVGKLEAVHDAKMAVNLLQVSVEVQERMVELLEILKTLNAELQVWL